LYKINGASEKFKNQLRLLFRPRTIHDIKKPDPLRETVPLFSNANAWLTVMQGADGAVQAEEGGKEK